MARSKNIASVITAVVVLTVKLDAQKRSSVAFQTGHTNGADCVVVPEVSFDDGTNFVTLACIDPTDAATIKTSFTGIDKCGVAPLNASAATHVRARRTDANATECFVSITVTAS